MISHIGIAVESLESAIPLYKLITGCTEPHIIDVPDQKVRVAIFDRSNDHVGARIELLESTDPDGPIARFIAKKGTGLHHVCVYVDDIESALAELKKNGARMIDQTPKVGAEGNRIAFVHPASANGVLIELEEKLKGQG